MLRKRIIFTLLYDDGNFVLSRNFRLQRVGDLQWLEKNYKFSEVASYIDELIVLDVTRKARDHARFNETVATIAKECFVPITAGGGISNISQARALLRHGADKIVVNSLLHAAPDKVAELAQEFGSQCVVASIDVIMPSRGKRTVLINNGSIPLPGSAEDVIANLDQSNIGEVYLNSVDRDGTGQGYDFDLIEEVAPLIDVPLIIAGGVGHAGHFLDGLKQENVNAVSTAHLFNFIGDGLKKARALLIQEGIELAFWSERQFD